MNYMNYETRYTNISSEQIKAIDDVIDLLNSIVDEIGEYGGYIYDKNMREIGSKSDIQITINLLSKINEIKYVSSRTI